MKRKIEVIYFVFGCIWMIIYPFLSMMVGIIKIIPFYMELYVNDPGKNTIAMGLFTDLLILLFSFFEVALIFYVILNQCYLRNKNIDIRKQIIKAFLFSSIGMICCLILLHILSPLNIKGTYLFISYPLLLNKFDAINIKNSCIFVLCGIFLLMTIIICSYNMVKITSKRKIIYYGVFCGICISAILKVWTISGWIMDNIGNFFIRDYIFAIVCSSLIIAFSIGNSTKEFIKSYIFVVMFLIMLEAICYFFNVYKTLFIKIFKSNEIMWSYNKLTEIHTYIYFVISYLIGGIISLIITKRWRNLFCISKNGIN